MSLYEEIILDDSGLRVDPKRKNVVDQLLKLINQISITDIETYIEDIESKLNQPNFAMLPAELKRKIMDNLDYKSLSRMRQVDKTSKQIVNSIIQKNITEQISIELLDKIICLPYYLNWIVDNYGNIRSDMNISGWKDITITGDRCDGKFVGLVKIKGVIHIEIGEPENRELETVIKGEGYFDSMDKPHFKLVLDDFQVPDLFWNEDNRYIYCAFDCGNVGIKEIKRTIYPNRIRMLSRYGVLDDENIFSNDKWTTDYVSFTNDESYQGKTYDYEIINVTLPNLGNKIAVRLVNEEEFDFNEEDLTTAEHFHDL